MSPALAASTATADSPRAPRVLGIQNLSSPVKVSVELARQVRHEVGGGRRATGMFFLASHCLLLAFLCSCLLLLYFSPFCLPISSSPTRPPLSSLLPDCLLSQASTSSRSAWTVTPSALPAPTTQPQVPTRISIASPAAIAAEVTWASAGTVSHASRSDSLMLLQLVSFSSPSPPPAHFWQNFNNVSRALTRPTSQGQQISSYITAASSCWTSASGALP